MVSHIGNWCSCISLGKIDEEQYNQYDIILKCTVLKITDGEWDKAIRVKVDAYYKGDSKKDTIDIISPVSSGMCGIFPLAGETWLIFANKENGKFRTHLCTRTKTMNPNAWDYNKDELEDDLKFLEAKRNSSLLRDAQ